MQLATVQPKTAEHAQARAGKLTGSRFKTILFGTPAGWAGLSKRLYEEEKHPEKFLEEMRVPSIMWGNQNEPLALANYEISRMVELDRPAFVKHPIYEFVGFSPDGIVRPDGMTEVKCPLNEIIHLQSASAMPEEHMPQVQGGIWVMDLLWCDFISFDPRQPEEERMFVHRIMRDEDYIERLRSRCLEFWEFHSTGLAPGIDLDKLDSLTF